MGDFTIFATRLKKAREKCGLKQNTLATKIGVTAQTISAYEKAENNGKGKNPTLENAVAIANELGVSLDWLCGRDGYTEKYSSKKTLGDVARDLVFLEKTVADIYLDTSTRTEHPMDLNSGYPVPGGIQKEYPSIVFTDKSLCNFINKWRKIKNLHDSDTIDDELYNLWLDKHLSLLDDIPAVEEPNDFNTIKIQEWDLEGELPF